MRIESRFKVLWRITCVADSEVFLLSIMKKLMEFKLVGTCTSELSQNNADESQGMEPLLMVKIFSL